MTAKPFTVALVGNPNAGKSTLFNALSGLRQHVGNFPGVTVEMKKGHFLVGERRIDIIDLPGTYSLAARSPDEMVAVDLLLGRRPEEPAPDAIISVVDASNLDRHLYLTTQLLDLERPVVLAVNMVDVAANQGLAIDYGALAKATGLTVVPIQANRGQGLDELRSALFGSSIAPRVAMPGAVESAASELAGLLPGGTSEFLARRLLFDVGGSAERDAASKQGGSFSQRLDEIRGRLAAAGCAVPGVEAKTRYAFIRAVTAKAIQRPAVRPRTATDRLDRVLTHRIWGTLVFLAAMFLLFQSIFVAANPLMDSIDDLTKWFAELVESGMGPGPFRSLLAEGIIAGVGGVVKFLPQILILFAAIAVLEDCGYMARAAFLMDRLMSRCGLSGKSFIPMLSSVACAVPGIMATRVIENRRDRLATIVVAPLMSCSARLPVYGLLIAAFLTEGQPFWVPGLTLFAMYMLGFVVAPVVALFLRRTLLKGERSLFVMELPAYKVPSLRNILRRVADAGWAFLRRAGTLILMSMVLVWALLYFPTHAPGEGESYPAQLEALKQRAEGAESDEAKDAAEAEARKLAARWKENSYLGQAGKALEPAFTPLGWDWKLGMAALASFPAREVIVGTLGIIYEQGDVDAGDEEVRKKLGETVREDWAAHETRGKYSIPTALSVMVFFALCCQCASTLAVIRRETKSWWWPAFTFTYMTVLAYAGAFAVFQVGKAILG
jgi:ferrous iron transport protein B